LSNTKAAQHESFGKKEKASLHCEDKSMMANRAKEMLIKIYL